VVNGAGQARSLARSSGEAWGGGSGKVPIHYQGDTPLMSIKLNDLQRTMLASVARNNEGKLLKAADNVSPDKKALQTALVSLMRRKLVERRGDEFLITKIGRAAVGIENVPEPAVNDSHATDKNDVAISCAVAVSGKLTKSAMVIDLLSRERGATIDELTTATDWLPHTVRAALTGLRKKGYVIGREKRGSSTCYRIGEARQ